LKDYAMSQAIRRRPVTAETRIWLRGPSMWDLWCTKWHWNRSFPSTSVLICQYHSTNAPWSSSYTRCFYRRIKGRSIRLLRGNDLSGRIS